MGTRVASQWTKVKNMLRQLYRFGAACLQHNLAIFVLFSFECMSVSFLMAASPRMSLVVSRFCSSWPEKSGPVALILACFVSLYNLGSRARASRLAWPVVFGAWLLFILARRHMTGVLDEKRRLARRWKKRSQ